MTLWCFGDSFVEPGFFDPIDTWAQQVSNQLNCDICNYGLGATSLEYMYTKFNNVVNKIQPNDYVIIVLTDPSRKYFFPNHPKISLPSLPNFSYEAITKTEKTALQRYFVHLANPMVYKVNLINFLYRVDQLSEKNNLKTIVFHAFDNTLFLKNYQFPSLHIVPEYLSMISFNECENRNYDKIIQDIFTYDPRINHLCMSNHAILADKVVEYIEHDVPIVLDNFISQIVTTSNRSDIAFQRKEFYWSKTHDCLASERIVFLDLL